MAGRPKGATNKIKAGKVAEICQEENVCLVRKQLNLAMRLEEDNKLSEAARIYATLMRYVYAQRRDEDAEGNPEQVIFSQEQIDRMEKLIGGD
jgi:hypothetical protein